MKIIAKPNTHLRLIWVSATCTIPKIWMKVVIWVRPLKRISIDMPEPTDEKVGL